MLPPLALQVIAGFTAPLTVALKAVVAFTVFVGAAGLIADTDTAPTVTVAVAVTGSPAALVTVSVNVVEAVSDPVPYAVPEATDPTPWFTLPAPPVNTAVSVVLPP
jgi:hypothetical protein